MTRKTRNAFIRIAIYLVVPVVVVWTGGWYMCRCNDEPSRVGEPVNISADNLKAHVTKLAADIGERHVFRPEALRRAADYISSVWREQGHEVRRQEFDAFGEECANLEVTVHGSNRPSEIVLVGAHYDSVVNSPGANDNATGIAALLELSRVFASSSATVPVAEKKVTSGSATVPVADSTVAPKAYGALPSRTLRFVAFTNEELFKMPDMGSRHYAKMARQRGDDIRVMISLETMGYYSDKPGSQHYPPFFSFFYPSRGNFIGFVSNLKSRPVMRRAVAAFRGHTDFPVECCATFEAIPGVDWSDHWSFWKEGYPAFMVTDTAPYRYPHYHTAKDTPDKVDYNALARVTEGLYGVLRALAAEK